MRGVLVRASITWRPRPRVQRERSLTKTFTNADWVLNQNKAIFRAFQWEIYGTRDNFNVLTQKFNIYLVQDSTTFSSCWNPWPSGQQTGAIPTEPTGQRFIRYQRLIKLFSVSQLKLKIRYSLTLVYHILNKTSRQEKTQKLVKLTSWTCLHVISFRFVGRNTYSRRASSPWGG